jgi:hypothetical protein
VETDSGIGGNAPDFFDRLDRAQLVVGVHDGDQNRFWADRAANFFRIDDSPRLRSPANGNNGDLDTLTQELLAAVQDCVMLDRRRDHVLARLARPGDGAEDR